MGRETNRAHIVRVVGLLQGQLVVTYAINAVIITSRKEHVVRIAMARESKIAQFAMAPVKVPGVKLWRRRFLVQLQNRLPRLVKFHILSQLNEHSLNTPKGKVQMKQFVYSLPQAINMRMPVL